MSIDPYAPGAQHADGGRYVEPDVSLARTLGVLNMVFAAVLLLGCNLCGGSLSLMAVAGAPLVAKGVGQEVAREQRRIERLKEQERDTEDEQERADLAQQRETIERKLAEIPDFGEAAKGFGSPASIVYVVADLALGIPLNVMMFAAGMGMLSLRPWGRTLAVWTMALKIVRLVPLELFYTIVIAPQWAHALTGFVVSSMRSGQAPPGFEAQISATYLGSYIGMGVAMLVLGPIYPAICLWLLTRPKVKAAFQRPAPATA